MGFAARWWRFGKPDHACSAYPPAGPVRAGGWTDARLEILVTNSCFGGGDGTGGVACCTCCGRCHTCPRDPTCDLLALRRVGELAHVAHVFFTGVGETISRPRRIVCSKKFARFGRVLSRCQPCKK